MNFNKILVPVAVIVMTIGAWRAMGWPGIALAAGGVVMWVLLHFTRLMTILKKAANSPVGHVGSAVMLNVKLQKGVNLMHVIALTKSLGERLSEPNAQPEIFKWTDAGDSYVVCTFQGGKLVSWEMTRPAEDSSEPAQGSPNETHTAS